MRHAWMRSLVATSLLLFPTISRAGESQPWIHVRVLEAKDGGTKVAVNLPLSLIDLALASIKDEKLKSGKVELGSSEIGVVELRRMWQELSKAGDAELVSVEDKDDLIKVERKGDRVAVRIASKASGKEKVRVDVPTSVVDALLAGTGNELDLQGAISELRKSDVGEFIHVDDGDSNVRIWIDEKPGS